jgi:hypothetical protein
LKLQYSGCTTFLAQLSLQINEIQLSNFPILFSLNLQD